MKDNNKINNILNKLLVKDLLDRKILSKVSCL